MVCDFHHDHQVHEGYGGDLIRTGLCDSDFSGLFYGVVGPGFMVVPFSRIRSQIRKRSGLSSANSFKLPSTRHCAWMRANSAISSHSLLLPYQEVRLSSLRIAFRQMGSRMLLCGSRIGEFPIRVYCSKVWPSSWSKVDRSAVWVSM